MIEKICVVQNNALLFNAPAFLEKGSGNLLRSTRPFGKRQKAASSAVRVFVVILRCRQRPDILSERFSKLMFVFENHSGLKIKERFVSFLLCRDADRAQRIVVLIVVPIDRR